MLGSTTLYTVVAALALSSQAKYHGLSRRAPSGWAYGYLEDYHTYHIRYLAIGCQFKHSTTFFDDCCHPMLGTETLEKNRPAHCVPGAQALASASRIEPTANPTSIAPPASATVKIAAVRPTALASSAPVATSAPVADEEDCEDDETVEVDEEVCEDDEEDDDEEDCEDDEVASAAPSASPVKAAPVKAAPTPSPTPSPTPTPSPVPSSVAAPVASSAAAPAPVASSSQAAAAPAPSSEAEVKPSSTKAAPESTPAPSNDNEEITGGKATFYYQGGNAGACGKPHGDYDDIVAMDVRRYGDTGKQSDLCGKSVKITNPKNGKSVTAVIADACPTCTNGNSIDMSKGAFLKIATEEEGYIDITWHFV